MRLTFLGATGTVTGSRYLLEHGGHRLLIDCGLFQGLKQLRLRNWEPQTPPARGIDAVVLSHAHLDHSGFVPRLVQSGFGGRVHCSAATRCCCPTRGGCSRKRPTTRTGMAIRSTIRRCRSTPRTTPAARSSGSASSRSSRASNPSPACGSCCATPAT